MPRKVLFRSTIPTVALGLAALAGLLGGVNWLIPGTIEGQADLPPIATVRADALTLRSLPNSASPALGVLPRGRMVHLRCRDGIPLHMGPWLGVIDGASERIGWVHATYVSDAVGMCPSSRTGSPDWRLRSTAVATEGAVNLRFGPSTGTIPLAKLPAGEILRTDGRWVTIGGERWILVRTTSGLSGWVRSDLIGQRHVLRSVLAPTTSQATATGSTVAPQIRANVGNKVEATVGVTYRPTGSTAALQKLAANQLESGIAAQLLSRTNPPTSVQVDEDGAIRLQLDLYRAATTAPNSYLEGNLDEMALSLLIGNGTLARHVEEVHGPEAALLLRAAFLVTGIPEPMADAAFMLLEDPAVQAQMSVLAASGMEVSGVMAMAIEARRDSRSSELERLHVAAREVEREIRRSGGLSAQRLAALSEVELVRPQRATFNRGMERVSSALDSRVRQAASALPTSEGIWSRTAVRADAVIQQAVTRTDGLSRDARAELRNRIEGQAGTLGEGAGALLQQVQDRGLREAEAIRSQSRETARMRGQQGRQQADQFLGQAEATARQRAEQSRLHAEEARRRMQEQARVQSEETRRQADQIRRQSEEAARRFQDRGQARIQTLQQRLLGGGVE